MLSKRRFERPQNRGRSWSKFLRHYLVSAPPWIFVKTLDERITRVSHCLDKPLYLLHRGDIFSNSLVTTVSKPKSRDDRGLKSLLIYLPKRPSILGAALSVLLRREPHVRDQELKSPATIIGEARRRPMQSPMSRNHFSKSARVPEGGEEEQFLAICPDSPQR
ncbi:hypothetical protein PUN28_020883 [Cardiocondyla obscurior]|uniref:Uncharacterized protein n=1 Tax=Cardiocondyla obscurior TaxID=286306 RepID=A0AAW2E9M6_9HYME